MSDLLKNMFRRLAIKYGHPRQRRLRVAARSDSPNVLDLSNRSRRSRSDSFRRRTPFTSDGAGSAPENGKFNQPPEKQRDLILPPAPDKCTHIYGGRADPYDAPDCLHNDTPLDFYVRKGGIWLKESDLQMLLVVLVGIFFTSLLVAFIMLAGESVPLNPALEHRPDSSSECLNPTLQSELSETDLYKKEGRNVVLKKKQNSEPEIGFDFSLATLGAKILTTRNTKPVAHYDASLFGYSFWSGLTADTQTDAPLQPILMPGRCWRFYGFPGTLVIQLAETVTVTSFTLSHALGASVPKSRLKTAPFQFEVWGLQKIDEKNPHFFGNFTFQKNEKNEKNKKNENFENKKNDKNYEKKINYENYEKNENSDQHFPVVFPTALRMPIVELKVLSNYGSTEYTCVYRFKVFGIPRDDVAEFQEKK